MKFLGILIAALLIATLNLAASAVTVWIGANVIADVGLSFDEVVGAAVILAAASNPVATNR